MPIGSLYSHREDPVNTCAASRNLAIGAFGVGFANIAHARRDCGCDDQRILALYGYT